MGSEFTVAAHDLEAALAYLEGLSLILRALDHEQRGRDGTDPLLDELQKLPNALYEWSPLHHQRTSGQGWAIVEHNLQAVRERLAGLQSDGDPTAAEATP